MGTTSGKLRLKKLDIQPTQTVVEEPGFPTDNSASAAPAAPKAIIEPFNPAKHQLSSTALDKNSNMAAKEGSETCNGNHNLVQVDAKATPEEPSPDDVAEELLIEHPDAPISANGLPPLEPPKHQPPAYSAKSVTTIARSLGRRVDSLKYTGGCIVMGGLLFCLGAAPQAIPALYLLFIATALPWRIISFVQRKWVFFLLDYCYFANIAAVLYLVAAPTEPRLGAMVYSLCEGPLAAAIIPWQCAWLLGSPDHTISVLIHSMPGLALYCHRYFSATQQPLLLLQQVTAPLLRLTGSSGRAVAGGGFSLGQRAVAYPPPCPEPALLWLFAAPMAFYVAWQLVYWLVVQVLCHRIIKAGKYDTSYLTLSRRARRANNVWYRLVQGTPARRLILYGLLQLAFTLVTLMIGAATYSSFALGTAWQAIKLIAPLYYGARHQCERLPAQQFEQGMKRLVGAGALAAAVMQQLDAHPKS